jgi:hypothetical protein
MINPTAVIQSHEARGRVQTDLLTLPFARRANAWMWHPLCLGGHRLLASPAQFQAHTAQCKETHAMMLLLGTGSWQTSQQARSRGMLTHLLNMLPRTTARQSCTVARHSCYTPGTHVKVQIQSNSNNSNKSNNDSNPPEGTQLYTHQAGAASGRRQHCWPHMRHHQEQITPHNTP